MHIDARRGDARRPGPQSKVAPHRFTQRKGAAHDIAILQPQSLAIAGKVQRQRPGLRRTFAQRRWRLHCDALEGGGRVQGKGRALPGHLNGQRQRQRTTGRGQPVETQPLTHRLHWHRPLQSECALARVGGPFAGHFATQRGGAELRHLQPVAQMEIHRRLHLSQQQVAFRIFHPAIGHGRIHDHHGRAFTFLERDIQRQLPPHGAGLIAPVFHLVG